MLVLVYSQSYSVHSISQEQVKTWVVHKDDSSIICRLCLWERLGWMREVSPRNSFNSLHVNSSMLVMVSVLLSFDTQYCIVYLYPSTWLHPYVKETHWYLSACFFMVGTCLQECLSTVKSTVLSGSTTTQWSQSRNFIWSVYLLLRKC